MSNETPWTPGPWLIEKEFDGDWSVWTRQPHTGTLATFFTGDINGDFPAEANASLTAIAPCLAESLNGLVEQDLFYEGTRIVIKCRSHSDAIERVRKARAALAKARGETA